MSTFSPPPVRSGLVALVAGMQAYFTAQKAPGVVTPLGWRYRTFQVNQGPGGGSRVCLIPGRIDPSSPGAPKVLEAGSFAPPMLSQPGPRMGGPLTGVNNPRPLMQWKKTVSMSVWGVDTSDTSDDSLQFAATEGLLEWAIRAMHNAVDPVSGTAVGLRNVQLFNAVWTLPPVERAFGRELVAFFEADGPLFDLGYDVVQGSPVVLKGPIT